MRNRYRCPHCDDAQLHLTDEPHPSCCGTQMLRVELPEPDTPESFVEWR